MKNAVSLNYLRFDSSKQIVWSQRCCCRCYRPLRLIRIVLKAFAVAAFYYWLDIFLSFSFFSFLALFNQLNRFEQIKSETWFDFLHLFGFTSFLFKHRHPMICSDEWIFCFIQDFSSSSCLCLLMLKRKFKLIEFSFVSCFITRAFMARINVFMHPRWTQFVCVRINNFNCLIQLYDWPINSLDDRFTAVDLFLSLLYF